MPRKNQFLDRYWSLLVAIQLPFFLFYAEFLFPIEPEHSMNPGRVICLIALLLLWITWISWRLLYHSWLKQKQHEENSWKLVTRALVLLFPGLLTTALALRELQVITRQSAVVYQHFQVLHSCAGSLKSWVLFLMLVDIIFLPVWAIIASFRSGKAA